MHLSRSDNEHSTAGAWQLNETIYMAPYWVHRGIVKDACVL